MNIFIRSFNPHINSKNGDRLPSGSIRGTPEWGVFEDLLKSVLVEIGCTVLDQPETPVEPDRVDWIRQSQVKIAVHKCKRDLPNFDLFYMQMHMRNLFTLDTNGWGADNSNNSYFDASLIGNEAARTFCESRSGQLLASGESKCDQPQINKFENISPFILVPLQIPRDYVLVHHSKVSVQEFIQAVGAWADSSRVRIAFKLHPHNKADIDLIKSVDVLANDSDYITKIDGNINNLIKICRGLIVINSGTGFEAILHGKPVATFGSCDYENVAFKGDLKQLEKAENFISDFSESQRILGYKFCYWYHFCHAYNLLDKVSTRTRLTSYLRSQLFGGSLFPSGNVGA